VAAGAAEVLAYMYDRSLDFFVPHAPPSLEALYPEHGSRPYLRSNLHYAPTWSPWWLERRAADLPDLHGDSLRFYSGYPLGGLGVHGWGPAAAASRVPVARRRRR
jgi:hypothetical protein